MKKIFIINTSKKYCGVDDYCLALYALFKDDMKFVFFVRQNSDFSRIIEQKNLQAVVLRKGYLRNLRLFKQVMDKERPDIVHIQTAKDYYLATAARPRPGIIITRHNSAPLPYYWIHLFILKKADVIITLSEFSKDVLLRQFPSLMPKVTMIYNSAPGACNTTGDMHREKRENNNQNTRFGFIGRVNSRKGIDHLIQALSILKNELGEKGFSIDVAGNFESKAYEKHVDEMITRYSLKNNINLLGFITQKTKFYHDIDVLIIPSLLTLRETCPLVAFEAMSHGIPLVSFASGAMPEIIEHGHNGFICKRESAAELAELLKNFCHSNELATKMGKNAHMKYLEMFSLQTFREKMAEIYLERKAGAWREN